MEETQSILLLTQVGEAGERAMALEEGADDYLNKPFDPHELVARIRAVLRRARPTANSTFEDYMMKGCPLLFNILETYHSMR